MKIKLLDIACARSGDKGDSSNIGIAFESEEVYDWAVEKITPNKVKDHLKPKNATSQMTQKDISKKQLLQKMA